MKYIIYILFFITAFSSSLYAQEEPEKNIFSITGYNRFDLRNYYASGDTLANDSVSAKRGLAGQTLFDLGFNIQPFGEDITAAVLIRATSDIGKFFGQGLSFGFRQFRVYGKLDKKSEFSTRRYLCKVYSIYFI